jgi:hypothetical protein
METQKPKPLTELQNARQVPGEPLRRWFTSETMDLIVWLDASGHGHGFQLCYGKPLQERALTWRPEQGFMHRAVDDGSSQLQGHKNTPLLVADGHADPQRLLQLFEEAGAKLPADIMQLVTTALRQHPDFPE